MILLALLESVCSPYPNESGFYYLQSRYYDPNTGRFINADAAEYSSLAALNLSDTNLFAYCRNNPIAHDDDEGEWVHIVVGAVVGGIVGAACAAINSGDKTDVITAAITGAASGALAASGVGLLGSILGNAAISMAGNASNQVVHNLGFKGFSVTDMLIDGAIGAASGAIGGPGASYGNANSAWSMGEQLMKRVLNTGEIDKAVSYYGKSMMNGTGKSIYRELTTSIVRSGFFATGFSATKQFVRRATK